MDFKSIIDSLPSLMAGVKLTLFITVIGIFFGFILGILSGIGRLAGTEHLGELPHGLGKVFAKAIRNISGIYVEFIRGTPIIVQAMFIYFAFPMIVRMLPSVDTFRMNALTAAVITIIINAGAYIAEIVRGSVISVHKGLLEAGMSLGISKFQLIRYIIWPIAIRRMIPPLGNQIIISLKDTSLFIVIGVGELTRQGQEIIASTFNVLEIWSTVALIYLIMTTVIAYSLRSVEKKLKIY